MDVKSMAKNALGSIWFQGGEEEEDFSPATTEHQPASPGHTRYGAQETGYGDHSGSGHGGSLLNGNRRLRPVAHSGSREKNIYTLRPKNLDEAAVAADCIKSGSAVVINHEMVDRATSLRIVDFMSGVCYGLDSQGHAMKLGDTIFLFTPGEYEISSDEVDYGENRDHFFKAEERANATAPVNAYQSSAAPSQHVGTQQSQSSYAPSSPSSSYSRSTMPSGQVTAHTGSPHVERRSWER